MIDLNLDIKIELTLVRIGAIGTLLLLADPEAAVGSRDISGVQRSIGLLIEEMAENALDLLEEKELKSRNGGEKDESKEAP